MEHQKKSQSKKVAPNGSLFDIELSLKQNNLTMIIQYGNRSHRLILSSQDARSLSNMLAKGADFLEKPDVVS